MLDDEDVSLVIEPAHPEGGNAPEVNHVADAPEDDTLSVGPDMPDLPLDAHPESSAPLDSTAETSPPAEVQPDAENEDAEISPAVEGGVFEGVEPPVTEPQRDPEEGASAQQQEETVGAEDEEASNEEIQEQEANQEQTEASIPQVEDLAIDEKEMEEELQTKQDSCSPVAETADNGSTSAEAATEENVTSQEPPAEPAEGAAQEVTEGGDRSCTSCACQSLFSNYNSHTPSRRKNRPCSLPVSELETVIASACGEPETPRSHYIRIHHLLHSLPSANHRPPSQEEEEAGEGENTSTTQDTTSTSQAFKTSKVTEEEGQEDEEDEDITQSPSQVQPESGLTNSLALRI